MPVPTSDIWFNTTGRPNGVFPAATPMDPKLALVDRCISDYEITRNLANLDRLEKSIVAWQEFWRNVGVSVLDDSFYLNKTGGVKALYSEILLLYKETPGSRDLHIAMRVRDELSNIKIADVDVDVDFSSSVKEAARSRMIDGKSLYDIVKDEWDVEGQDRGSDRSALDRATLSSLPTVPENSRRPTPGAMTSSL